MNVAELLATASGRTGLDDFGPDGFREGLEVFVDSLEREAELTDAGDAAIARQAAGLLANRLRVVNAHKRDPSLADQVVERPLVVLSMPRTGTSYLSALLFCDPKNRALMQWEVVNSVPPPRAETFTTDPRIEAARAGWAALDAQNPQLKSIHFEAPDGPTGCASVLAQDFKSIARETLAKIPTYSRWLLACDQMSAYEYHRSVLQLLQSEAPGRWLLRSPHHCLGIDSLLTVYPDARLVMTHRDPVTVCASMCSFARTLSGTFSDADHTAYINEHWPVLLETCVTRAMAFRDRRPEVQWCDVSYSDLVADPVKTVALIYDAFGDELSAAAERLMRAYAEANPQGVHGRHRYDAWGLDEPTLRDRFSRYTERFADYLEAA